MNSKVLIYGGLAVVAILLLSNKSSTGILGFTAPPPANPTATNVAAVGVATGGILAGLKGLFGGTAAPLSGGTAPNVNDGPMTFNATGDYTGGSGSQDVGPAFGELAGDSL